MKVTYIDNPNGSTTIELSPSMRLTKSNSSYGNWCVSYPGKYTTEHKFFWHKIEAIAWMADTKVERILEVN